MSLANPFQQMEEEIFRILLVTDTHLGHAARNPIRRLDSFLIFEEILKLAKLHEVDFIVHSGDLFHENSPSRETIYRTTELLREYCLGKREETFTVQNSAEEPRGKKFQQLNCLDQNFRVALPMFCIHGNHDDPTGQTRLSAVEQLGVGGLLNYFGKQETIDRINIEPLLFQKGNTKLALYGLGHIKDEKLHQLFLEKRVHFKKQSDQPDYFNILLFHQNRVPRAAQSHIPEHFLDSILDLVVWGHEHDCKITPALCSEKGFYVTQPGSSLSTALTPNECTDRFVGLLEVKQKRFKLQRLLLHTPRPALLKEINLETLPKYVLLDTKKTEDVLAGMAEEALQAAAGFWEARKDTLRREGSPSIVAMLPAQPPHILLRFYIDCGETGVSVSPYRIGQRLFEKVANPKDAVLIKRRQRRNEEGFPKEMTARSYANMEETVQKGLQAQELELLPATELAECLLGTVKSGERDGLEGFLQNYVKTLETQLRILKVPASNEEIRKVIETERRHRERHQPFEGEEENALPGQEKRKRSSSELSQ